MTLPNFFIVGAAKSGTTTIYHCLAQHPDVFMPDVKEPHFFVDWGWFVKDQAGYEALFAGCRGEKAVGEASTGYLFDEAAPGRIKRLCPDARIIIILRNPVEMAFALWRHMRRLGKRGEKLSFPDALKAEPGRMADPAFRAGCIESWHGNFYYFSRALYHDQVKRYLDTFGPDRVLVLVFEEFRQDPLRACREIFRFVGVDEGFVPDTLARNVGREVRHRGLQKLLERPEGLSAKLMAVVPTGVKDALTRLNSSPPPRLDGRLRKDLERRYEPDVRALERLTGRDLSIWF